MFSAVTIVADWTFTEMAAALRGMFDCLRVETRYHRLVQKRQSLELFAQGFDTPYTVLLSHGDGDFDKSMRAKFEVVHQKNDNYESSDDWEETTLDFTAQSIPQIFKASGTVISIACGGGHPVLARAYLQAGADRFIGSSNDDAYVDLDSAFVFLVNFFYLVTFEDRDYATKTYTDQEACLKAAGIVADFASGAQTMRFYDRSFLKE